MTWRDERRMSASKRIEKGDRIELVAMPADPDPIPAGRRGTVEKVTRHEMLGGFDQVCVRWDDGRTLMLCVPPDEVRVLTKAYSYCNPEDVTAIRVYHEGPWHGGRWNVDGIDLDGNCTEGCLEFATEDEAREYVERFRKQEGIPDSAVVVYDQDAVVEKTAEIRRLFTRKDADA